MVWGMLLPSGFGEFWPYGQFEGLGQQSGSDAWAERLRDYHLAQSDEEQKRLFDYRGGGAALPPYYSYVSKKLTSECGSKPVEPYLPAITPIEQHEPPQFFQIERSPKSLASFIKLNNRIVAVDEMLKEIIERLEPSMHGFFPIEIRMPRGKISPKAYYTLVIGQYFDSFSPEESNEGSFVCYPEFPNYYNIEESKKNVTGLALTKAVFGNAHLWRERGFREWLTCFSDELVAEITKAGLRIPRHYKMKEV